MPCFWMLDLIYNSFSYMSSVEDPLLDRFNVFLAQMFNRLQHIKRCLCCTISSFTQHHFNSNHLPSKTDDINLQIISFHPMIDFRPFIVVLLPFFLAKLHFMKYEIVMNCKYIVPLYRTFPNFFGEVLSFSGPPKETVLPQSPSSIPDNCLQVFTHISGQQRSH